jgi:phosphosulfolactate phosphohydrolase-like enzyme
LEQYVSNALHYGTLKELGFQEDIAFCLNADGFDVLPKFEDGRIML